MKTSAFVRFPFLLFCGAFLVGCEQTIKITDGILPDELLPYARPGLGTYHGQIERRGTGLLLSLEGNRLIAKSTDDVIAPVCESRIGDLKRISYKENKDKTIQITEVIFDFDPNLCGDQVSAKTLKFSVVNNQPLTLDLLYLDHLEYEWRCSPGYYPPQPEFPGPPDGNCWQQQVMIFNSGRFIHD